jgi:hypothetical protein
MREEEREDEDAERGRRGEGEKGRRGEGEKGRRGEGERKKPSPRLFPR